MKNLIKILSVDIDIEFEIDSILLLLFTHLHLLLLLLIFSIFFLLHTFSFSLFYYKTTFKKVVPKYIFIMFFLFYHKNQKIIYFCIYRYHIKKETT